MLLVMVRVRTLMGMRDDGVRIDRAMMAGVQ